MSIASYAFLLEMSTRDRERERKKTPKAIWLFIKNATIFPGKGDFFFRLFCRTFCHWSTVREGYFFLPLSLHIMYHKIYAMCPTFMFVYFDEIIHFLRLRSEFRYFLLFSPHHIIPNGQGN